MAGNEKAAGLLSAWGLSLAQPLGLEGRVIEPEKIFLSRSSFQTNPQCDWTRNLGNDVLVAVKIDSWILVCTERERSKAQEFSKCFAEVSRSMGIQSNPPKMIFLPNDRTDTYVNKIRDEINSSVSSVF